MCRTFHSNENGRHSPYPQGNHRALTTRSPRALPGTLMASETIHCIGFKTPHKATDGRLPAAPAGAAHCSASCCACGPLPSSCTLHCNDEHILLVQLEKQTSSLRGAGDGTRASRGRAGVRSAAVRLSSGKGPAEPRPRCRLLPAGPTRQLRPAWQPHAALKPGSRLALASGNLPTLPDPARAAALPAPAARRRSL